MEITINWKPEKSLLEKLTAIARQRGQSPEALVTEAVTLYVEAQPLETSNIDSDPLVGLFVGPPDLAAKSEDILQQQCNRRKPETRFL
ncbi:MAG: hypothetical protein KME26_05770 [Oscillatoria princeps RMCB-10]|jgi:hypothetical protein|nr:hypothetical protein [Oscillatoria princeps RMCB-10]